MITMTITINETLDQSLCGLHPPYACTEPSVFPSWNDLFPSMWYVPLESYTFHSYLARRGNVTCWRSSSGASWEMLFITHWTLSATTASLLVKLYVSQCKKGTRRIPNFIAYIYLVDALFVFLGWLPGSKMRKLWEPRWRCSHAIPLYDSDGGESRILWALKVYCTTGPSTIFKWYVFVLRLRHCLHQIHRVHGECCIAWTYNLHRRSIQIR